MREFLVDCFFYASFVSFGVGLLVAFVTWLSGNRRSALSAAWTGWGVALACFFIAVALSAESTDDGDDEPSTPSGGLSGGEAMMLPAFRDCSSAPPVFAPQTSGTSLHKPRPASNDYSRYPRQPSQLDDQARRRAGLPTVMCRTAQSETPQSLRMGMTASGRCL